MGNITDEEIKVSYAGFLSVSAVTVYELAIKNIFYEFASQQNKAFGIFVENHFSRINGKIKIENLIGTHIIKFGQKYRDRFKNLLAETEEISLTTNHISIKSEYDNIIQCRHEFVHNGAPTLTIHEVLGAYHAGKEVIDCLYHSLVK
jgi:hypothetical protein